MATHKIEEKKMPTVKEAVKILKQQNISVECIGEMNTFYEKINSIDLATPSDLVMIKKKSSPLKTNELIQMLMAKEVAVIVTTHEMSKYFKKPSPTLLLTSNPRLAVAILINCDTEVAIHETAIINPNSSLGRHVEIGPYSIIGSEGLSVNEHEGKLINTPHFGGVRVGDSTSIGASCTIVRAIFGHTVVGENCRLGHNVSIGHGCRIGDRVVIAPGSVISGSCTVANDVWIGPNSSIKENIKIGCNAFIGIGSVVLQDVPDGGIVSGNPARLLKKAKRPW